MSSSSKSRKRNRGKKRSSGKSSSHLARSPLVGSTMAASAVSQPSGQSYDFGPGGKRGALRCRFKTPFSGVITGTTTAIDGMNFPGPATASYAAINPLGCVVRTAAAVTATPAPFQSPVLQLLGGLFTRYRVNRLKFLYHPAAPTSGTSVVPMFFAYSSDPAHELSQDGTILVADPLNLPNSLEFSPWLPWEMDVSKDLPIRDLYTQGEAGTSFSNIDIVQLRQSCVGGIFLTGTSNGTTTASSIGELYLEIDLTFEDICPQKTIGTLGFVFGRPFRSALKDESLCRKIKELMIIEIDKYNCAGGVSIKESEKGRTCDGYSALNCVERKSREESPRGDVCEAKDDPSPIPDSTSPLDMKAFCSHVLACEKCDRRKGLCPEGAKLESELWAQIRPSKDHPNT